jgi:hypothetical protein
LRPDIAVNDVLSKCEVLKRAGLWLSEPKMRPRAWMDNFETSDRHIAARLLDRFTFYNSKLTNRLLMAAFDSIGDGMPKGPRAPDRSTLLTSVPSAVWTPVQGEIPNPTDSGNLLCRLARQELGVSQASIVDNDVALARAQSGNAVIFVDDFVGSGQQFLTTWQRNRNGNSFATVNAKSPFTAIYVTLVATSAGIKNIHHTVPSVAVCATHVLELKSTVYSNSGTVPEITAFLAKYAPRLTPSEPHIAKHPRFVQFGFGELGLMFGFEHSIPDSTLPIFWAPGNTSWEPLIERT